MAIKVTDLELLEVAPIGVATGRLALGLVGREVTRSLVAHRAALLIVCGAGCYSSCDDGGSLLKIHLIAMKIAFILSTLASAPPSVPAAPVQSAHAFVESIGVNTHLGYTGTPYYRFRKVEAALERLGVHHIRDAILLRRPDVDRRYRALAKRGIKLDALVGQPKGGE